MSDKTPSLTPVMRRFILHWGEMGARWGVNRTVAQVHALLYLWPAPLHAEQIAETLSVARSNVSTSLRELQAWGIVRLVHVFGDRRDHFTAIKDVWEMFQTIVDERKRREIDPTVAVLRDSLAEMERGGPEDYTRGRLAEMLDFFQSTSSIYDELRRTSPAQLRLLAKSRRLIRKLLARGD